MAWKPSHYEVDDLWRLQGSRASLRQTNDNKFVRQMEEWLVVHALTWRLQNAGPFSAKVVGSPKRMSEGTVYYYVPIAFNICCALIFHQP